MPDSHPKPHVRRPRYRGTHPRAFGDKYKELNPERYTDAVAKVLASGKTPAGSHRPIMVREILDVLALQPGQFAVDATLGYGGHSTELLNAVLPGGRLLALDVDPIELPRTEARLRARTIPTDALIVCRSNFAGLSRLLAAQALPPADAILADLGLSSMQIDDPARGFTYKSEGPLDLRMNPQRGQPASALLASLNVKQLSRMLEENADQPDATTLAARLLERQRTLPISTTTALADAVRACISDGGRVDRDDDIETSVRRVFQALRVAVNDEFGALQTFLHHLPDCLAPGGRAAILTFHSGEDRRVKHAFRDGLRAGLYRAVSDDVMRAGSDERHANPRSTAAKLRWAIRAETAGR